MERNRDARRGAVAVANGAGSARRRQRNSSRDSPDEDAGMETLETARPRDRGGGGGKKDGERDRDRSGRSKRPRGERMLHASSSNRDDGDESSEESLDDEDDEEEDEVTVRFAPPSHPPPAANPSTSSSPQQQSNNNHHHHHHHHHQHQHHSQSQQQQQQRKSFPPKVFKPPLVWKTDEMIGVAVPRKARSAVKRSHECWVSGGAGVIGVGGERQASASPSRLSPASATQISPSSANAPLRKKMKLMSGNKQRPPKMSKAYSSSVIQDDIEIEVAEVLFGLTRQQFCPPKQETHKVDTRELNGTSVNESGSRASSPSSISPSAASSPSVLTPSNATSHHPAIAAPKWKKSRPLKFEDESPARSPTGHAVPTSSVSSAAKLDADNLIKMEASSPISMQDSAPQVVENGDSTAAEIAIPQIAVPQPCAQREATKLERGLVSDLKMSSIGPSIKDRIDCKDGAPSASEATLCTNLDAKLSEASTLKKQFTDSPRQEKFSIDLMAPPPGKISPDGEDGCDSDQMPKAPEAEMALKSSTKRKYQEMLLVEQAASRDCDMIEKSTSEKQMVKEQSLDLRFDLEKAVKDDGHGKSQIQKQQHKAPQPKQEKSAPTTPMNMPMAVGTWPGGFPCFGYMGQVPSLQGAVPMDGPTVTSNALPPSAFISHQSRQKRCATHFYIAQTIHNYQKLARMNPFWAAATTNPIYGAKPYNLNIMPASDATLFTNPMPATFTGRNMGSLHDTKISAVGASAYTGHPSKDKMAATNSPMIEISQRKQVVLQQTPHTGSTTNMLHAPAFIFPISQQQTAAVTPTANRAAGNLVAPAGASTSAAGSSGNAGALAPMNLSFTGLSAGDAQYLAMMQNNPYPFSFPPHIAGASPFKGAAPPQAMPYFFPSHMLHPSQIQPPQHQQQQQHAGPSQTAHAPQNHQKTGASSGSSSSQKHIQQSNIGSGLGVAGTNSNGFPASNQRQHALTQNAQRDSYKGSEGNPSTSESRVSHAPKGTYGQSFSIGNHHQKFSLMPSAAAGGHGDKQTKSQQPQQKQNVKMDLTSPPAFTMPFTSFNGTGVVLPGLDFSSLSHNQAIFQTLPEAPRHGYHQIATASLVAQKKKHTTDDGKSVARESVNGTVTAEVEQKAIADSKRTGSGMQHLLASSKPGVEPTVPVSSVLNNKAVDNSTRTLNLIQAPSNGSRTVSHPLGASVPTSSMAMGAASIPSQQHQQQMLQLQKQQQQHQLSSSRSKTSASINSSSVHSDRTAGSPTVTKFPQPLTGFPQSINQDGTPSQIKTSSGRSSASISVSSAPPIVKSNHLVHQQVRSAQQTLPAQSHQTQISFGMNSVKAVPAAGQHFSVVSNPSIAAPAVGSPSNSVSKSAGSSPRALTSAKPAAAATVGHHLQQSSSKTPASSSTSKTFPVGNMPSILGHPQNTTGNSSTKLQQQQQLPQSLKQQPFPQAQFYFTNAYMQPPYPVQSNAATAAVATGYYQKRQADQATQQIQQQQLTSVSGSSAMLALCSSALPLSGTSTSDPSKTMAAAAGTAANTKATPQANLLHPSQFTVSHSATSGSPHTLMPATFPYTSMSTPATCVKATASQKPAAASDNLNVCWQPEKR